MLISATEPAMPTESGKPLIVISYAHEDEPEKPVEGEVKWLSLVIDYLRPAIHFGAFDLDPLMPDAADMDPEIEQKLRACDIYILLVSSHSLSSDYVCKEIAIIRERQARGDDVHFYPLLLTPTPNNLLDIVNERKLRPRDGRPLSVFSIDERHRHMDEAAEEIERIAGEIAERKAQKEPVASPRFEASDKTERERNDSQWLKAWLEGQSREVVVAIAVRAALRAAPLIARVARSGLNEQQQREMSQLASLVFRAIMSAHASIRFYPTRIPSSSAIAAASAINHPAILNIVATDAAKAAAFAKSSAAYSAVAAAVVHRVARASAASDAVDAFTEAFAAADASTESADPAWQEIEHDFQSAQDRDFRALLDAPLWRRGEPRWVRPAVGSLRAALPEGENWDVWFDWYEDHLLGGPRGDDYELVFASVPPEEWDEGSRAANTWIRAHLPLRPDRVTEPVPIRDRESLENWLLGQTAEVSIAIAARAALRAVPLAGRVKTRELGNLTSVIFRASAMSWIGANYQSRDDEFRPSFVAGTQAALTATGRAAGQVSDTASANAFAASAAALGAAAAHAAANTFTSDTALASDAAAVTAAGAVAAAEFAAQAIAAHVDANSLDTTLAWHEVRADAEALERTSNKSQAVRPLWSMGIPNWAKVAWSTLKSTLPRNEDWEVWIHWYEVRLFGGSRGEEYELVFASVPQQEWDKGSAAANAWIKAHLPGSEDYTPKEAVEEDSLKQQAALYAFRLSDERIVVAPEDAKPEDREATRDFLDESRRKSAELRERLIRVQADTRLQRTMALLDDRLAPPMEAIRIGLVLSSIRSLESDVRAFDTEEGRREHAVDLIAALDDLAVTVRDFASQFPRSREILANQIALELVEEPRALDAAVQASENLAIAAESHPELIDRDAPVALREPKEAAEGARATADRAKQVGLRLLTAANFARIVTQVRETAVESWDEMLNQVPRAAGKAVANVVIAGPGLAFGLWAGHSGLALLLDTAGAIAAINGAIGHPGGAFDRILKTIEKVAAKKPVADAQDREPPEHEEKQPAKRKAQAKTAAPKRKANRRAQKEGKN
jgi:hypothetical protein